MRFNIIIFTALFLLTLITGTFWGTWFTLTRTIENFSAAEFIHIGKVIIHNVANPMKVLMPSCILFMILSVWFYHQKKTIGFYFNLSALILIIISLLITLLIEVPIDNQIKTWTAVTVPSDWEETRRRWQFFHGLRTLTSLTSCACFTLSIILNKGYPTKEAR
jgi:uncharacterized membrane protein